MKIRTDFITNSSSSSFVISKDCDAEILEYLENDMLAAFPPIALEESKYFSEYEEEVSFFIIEDDENYYLYTSMDNSNLQQYLEENIPSHRSNHQDDEYCAALWLQKKFDIDIYKYWEDYIDDSLDEDEDNE